MILHKKFYLLLIALALVAGLLLFFEIKKTSSIIITPNKEGLVKPEMAAIQLEDPDSTPLGNPGAPITIVMFADLGCSHCADAYLSFSKFARENPEKVRFFWRDAPTRSFFGGDSSLAHIAAYCASRQQKFWPFIDLVFQNKSNLKETGLNKVANGLKLNIQAWNNCRDSDMAKNKIIESTTLADSLGLTTLPGIFINNKKINWDGKLDLTDLLNRIIAE